MLCQKCGAQLKPESTFCTQCGEPVRIDSEAPAAQESFTAKPELPAAPKPAAEPEAPAPKKKYSKKLGLPFAALLTGVLGWGYGLLFQLSFLTNIYYEATGQTAGLGAESDYVPLAAAASSDVLIIVAVAAVVLSFLLLWGLLTCVKRLWNRIAHKDD